jgi:hypothetical protein
MIILKGVTYRLNECDMGDLKIRGRGIKKNVQ